jgi:dihydrolipoamide dehydrogenase
MAETSFDLAAAPAAMSRRSAPRSSGSRPRVVEREHLGGICLNWGCIPTKALLRTSEVYGLIKHADALACR